MNTRLTNIHSAPYAEGTSPSEGEPTYRFLDLSGQHLGVRIEEIPIGANSSHHHYHTAEEEHVLVLDGEATLHLGDDKVDLTPGDHIWFPAGEEVAHHIENTSDGPFKFLVFGERKSDDVVFYPHRSTLLVKSSAGFKAYDYNQRTTK
ncbi:MAG: cupin domain-containing protein [Alphaproteobacteria bacterium]